MHQPTFPTFRNAIQASKQGRDVVVEGGHILVPGYQKMTKQARSCSYLLKGKKSGVCMCMYVRAVLIGYPNLVYLSYIMLLD